jgi:hypothetical protein
MDGQTTNPAPSLGRPQAWITTPEPCALLGISQETQRGEA